MNEIVVGIADLAEYWVLSTPLLDQWVGTIGKISISFVGIYKRDLFFLDLFGL